MADQYDRSSKAVGITEAMKELCYSGNVRNVGCRSTTNMHSMSTTYILCLIYSRLSEMLLVFCVIGMMTYIQRGVDKNVDAFSFQRIRRSRARITVGHFMR